MAEERAGPFREQAETRIERSGAAVSLNRGDLTKQFDGALGIGRGHRVAADDQPRGSGFDDTMDE